MSLSPSERALRSRIAAHRSWALTADPSARTAPARAASMARFEREVDPDGTLAPADRARRAESAKKAYFASLALKSAVARRRMKEAATTLAEVDEALAEGVA